MSREDKRVRDWNKDKNRPKGAKSVVIPRTIRQQAFSLYCMNIPVTEIAKYLGIRSSSTIFNWLRKESWRAKREELLKIKQEHSLIKDDDLEEKLINSIIMLWTSLVNENPEVLKSKMRPRDILETIKMRRLIKGESTENVNVIDPFKELKKELNLDDDDDKEQDNE